jgi:hypothetical protein
LSPEADCRPIVAFQPSNAEFTASIYHIILEVAQSLQPEHNHSSNTLPLERSEDLFYRFFSLTFFNPLKHTYS